MDLNKKIVLVTGGARGIGAEISHAMCEAGASVILSDMLEKEGKSYNQNVNEIENTTTCF